MREVSDDITYQKQVDKALQNLPLTREECMDVLSCKEEGILVLLQSAFVVRNRYFGKSVGLHVLLNAKSGLCSEDCSYCSQSAVSSASIDTFPMVDAETMIEGARAAMDAGAKRYCIVASGRSPHDKELKVICKAVQGIKREMGIEVCTSLGLLTEDTALALKEAGVDRYNHNLNAAKDFYPNICSTHTFEDRKKTLRYARSAGMELCCGALFGMGESDNDIIETAFSLRKVRPDSIPINFLHPIPGTPVAKENNLTPIKCLSVLCLIRFLNPSTEVRAAGGREYNFRSLQSLVLYPANSIFVSGYLTTPGQTPEDARQMIEDMGFEVEIEKTMEIASNL